MTSRVDEIEPVFVDLSPAAVMTATQLRDIRRRVARIDRLWRDVLGEYGLGIRDSVLQSKYEALQAQLAASAEEALKSATGIEPYMVLNVVGTGGRRTRLQVESVSFSSGLYGVSPDGLVWHLSGRNLRKDGTLGCQAEVAYLSVAYVERRGLDGMWRPLVDCAKE